MMYVVTLTPWLKYSERKQQVTCVVLHSTAGASAESSIKWLSNILVRASYHYIIERDGTVYKCVPSLLKAWHAGKSVGPDGPDVNQYSIGIAFANDNKGESYTDAQKDSCENLIALLYQKFRQLRTITTHRLISPGRKTDPKGFAFHAFARERTLLKPWRPNEGTSWD